MEICLGGALSLSGSLSPEITCARTGCIELESHTEHPLRKRLASSISCPLGVEEFKLGESPTNIDMTGIYSDFNLHNTTIIRSGRYK